MRAAPFEVRAAVARTFEKGETIMRKRFEARAQRVLAVLEQLSPQTRKEVLDCLETLNNACAALSADGAPTVPSNAPRDLLQFSPPKASL